MNWHDYFLNLAMTTSRKSKDESTQVGAVIATQNNIIVSLGFNGLPRGVPDDERILQDRSTKLQLVLHAEENALTFAQRDCTDCTIYVWPCPPCAHCAARIAQAGIKKVVTCKPTEAFAARWEESLALADWVYTHAGIEIVYHWEAQ